MRLNRKFRVRTPTPLCLWQVWPTLKLTEEEAMLFKRNSRVFVTDLGKSIPMTAKFELAKAMQDKVPHQDARSLLYESDLHLDAVGEHPRYVEILWGAEMHWG